MIWVYFIIYYYLISLTSLFLGRIGINPFIGVNFISCFFILFLINKYNIEYKKIFIQWQWEKFFICFISYIFLMFFLASIFPDTEKIPQDVDRFIMENVGLITIITVGIVVPILEEIFFRHLFLDWFKKYMGTIFAILSSSILFTICHYDDQFSYQAFISIFFLGFLFAIMREYLGKSILYPIVFHCINNLLVVFVLIYGKNIVGV